MPGRIFRIKSKPLITTEYGNAQQKKRSPKPREREKQKKKKNFCRRESGGTHVSPPRIIFFVNFHVTYEFRRLSRLRVYISCVPFRFEREQQRDENSKKKTTTAWQRRQQQQQKRSISIQDHSFYPKLLYLHTNSSAQTHTYFSEFLFFFHIRWNSLHLFWKCQHESVCVYILWTIFFLFCFSIKRQTKRTRIIIRYVDVAVNVRYRREWCILNRVACHDGRA